MKALMSTAASRAWLGIALIGFVIVVVVFALGLSSRLGAGQGVIEGVEPAFTDERIAGTRSGTALVSRYVDVLDPLLTARGGANKDVATLIRLMRRKLGLSTKQVRRILRREAPHTEALTRALPLDGVAAEVEQLTSYLGVTLGLPEEELGATLQRDFPRISQALTALRSTSDGWYDVAGIEGLTRLSRGKPVRTVPGLRKYYRDDLVPLMVEHKENVQGLVGAGGVGYIPYLLLAIGLGLMVFGVLAARQSLQSPPGRMAWMIVMGFGLVLVALVVLAQYFPRLGGAQEAIVDLKPVFAEQRVRGMAIGTETLQDATAFGDPIATRRGGGAREARQLYRLLAARTGGSIDRARGELHRDVPRTHALLTALPLSDVSREVPRLVRYLSRALRMPRRKLLATLRKRTPGLAQALLTMPRVTRRWNAIPATEGMTRFDGVTPVRSGGEFGEYLRGDLAPVLVASHEDFDTLASGWLPIDVVAPLVFIAGCGLILYAGILMRVVAPKE